MESATRIDPGRNQDVPLRCTEVPSTHKDSHRCADCDDPSIRGRNLVVCLDRAAKKLGKKNTTVLALCSQISQTHKQLLYYAGGAGDSKGALRRMVDNVFTWSLDERVLDTYKWLCETFNDGDKIYIFGFSRGAYEARTLAAMIEKVGLVFPQNADAIPLAYHLYTDGASRVISNFKGTLSRNVRVHFLCVLDTVLPTGVVQRSRPGTDEASSNVCYFRQALALDEIRAKYTPLTIFGRGPTDTPKDTRGDTPKVKEVWFLGSHSDIGGKNRRSFDFGIPTVVVAWSLNEASSVGLDTGRSRITWGLRELQELSSTGPTRRVEGVTSRPQFDSPLRATRSQGRVVHPGQKIHMSICFAGGDYKPKATLHPNFGNVTWADIIGAGIDKTGDVSWAENLEQYLEMDLFETSDVPELIQQCISANSGDGVWSILEVMASVRKGAQAILEDGSFITLLQKMLRNRMEHTRTVIHGLTRHDSTKSMVHLPGFAELVERSIYQDMSKPIEGSWFANILWDLTRHYGEFPLSFLYPTLLPQDWQTKSQSLGFRQAILATLYFARFLSSKDRDDLDKAEGFLKGISESPSLQLTDTERGDLENSLATCLEARGSIEELHQAVEIREGLARRYPNQYDFDLAITRLKLYTMKLHDQCGEGPESPMTISTRSRGELVKENGLEFASCLTNLSNRCYDLGLQDEALNNAQKSVSLFRQVLGDSVTAAHVDMATALNNLSNRLSDAGRDDEALATIEEAIRIRRSLVKSDANAHQPNLAISLANLSRQHLQKGDLLGSFETGSEAVAICRDLSIDQAEELYDPLALSLDILSSVQLRLEQPENALDNVREAVRLRRLLANDRPAVFYPELAGSMYNLSRCYSDLARPKDALAQARECLTLCDSQDDVRSRVFTDKLERVKQLAQQLSRLQEREGLEVGEKMSRLKV